MKRPKTLLSLSTIIYMLAIVFFIIINCTRDNPFDINSSNYTPGKKPHVHFVDSLISGYLLDTIKIPITWEDTAIGGDSGAVKKFYIDWTGDGHFSDSISGVQTDTLIISKVFNPQNNLIRIKAIDFDGDTSAIDSAKLEIKTSIPAIISINAPVTIEIGVTFTIKLNSTDTGGVITSYLWAIDEKTFSRTTDSDSLPIAFNQIGVKTIKVKALDNKKIESAERVISIGVTDPSDTVGPQIVFLSPLNADTVRTRDCVVSLQVVDPSGVSGVTLNDAIAMQLVGSTWRGTTSLSHGENVLNVTAIDAKGFTNGSNIHVFYSQAAFDQTPPVITLLAPAKWIDTVNTDSLIVKLLARDESGVAGMFLDSEQLKLDTTDTSYSTISKLRDGVNNFVVRSVDRMGNTGLDSLLVFWKKDAVDTVAPLITITKPITLQHITDSVLSIKGTVTDASKISSVKVNGIETVFNYPGWSSTCNLKRGYDTITITATDGSINRNSSEKSVIVIRNLPPLFTEAPRDTIVKLNSSVIFPAVVADDDNALVFSLARTPVTFGTVSPLASTMSKTSFTYTAGNIGIDTFRLFVTDPWGDVDTAKWRVVVIAPLDSTPIITTDPKTLPVTITALDTCRDAIHAQDPHGKPLIYSFVQPAPTGIIIDSLTGKITWVPIATDTGAKVIIIQVSNGHQTDSITWKITVLSRNLPPMFSPLGNQTVNENQKLQLTLNATDFNNDLLEFSFGSTFPSGAQLDSNRFSWTPAFSNSGVKSVVFVVRERNRTPSLSDTQSITITVNNVNQKPVLSNPGTITGVITQTINYTLLATDPDNDRITYSMVNAPGSSSLNENTFSWTPFFTDAGTYYVKFIASDNSLSDTITVAVRINSSNSAPVLINPGNVTISENHPIEFSLGASDPNNDSLIFSMKNAPSGSTLNDKSFFWQPNYTQAGSYTVKFYVHDNVFPPLFDSQTVIITVNNVNAPPELTSPGTQTIYEKSTLSFQLQAQDLDGTPVRYFSPHLPSGATITPAGMFSWTPEITQAGSYLVTFIALDSSNVTAILSDTAIITINVNNTNPALPVLVLPNVNASSQPKSVTFKWSGSPNGKDSSFLQVARDTGFGDMFFQDSTLTDTVKTVLELANGTTYYWRVNALNPGGRSGWTTKRSFATIPIYALYITATNGSVTITSTPSSGPFDSATVVSLVAVPATGYHFANWSGDASGTDSSTNVSMNGVKNVIANFSLNTYQLTVSEAAGGTITAPIPSSVSVTHGTLTTITASANPGYTFSNWTVISGSAIFGSATSISTTVAVTGDAVVQANFSANIYSLTVGAATGGTITVPTSSPVSVTYGTPTTITASANSGYTFINWTVTGGTATFGNVNSNSTTVTLMGNATVQANFSTNAYSLSVGAGTGGSISVPVSSPVNVPYGAPTTITASANPGYTFLNWTVISGPATFASSTSISTAVTLTADAVVRANFTANHYSLSVGTTTGGTITAPTSSPVSVTYGTPVTVTASPNPGYTFVNWTVISGTATFDNANSNSATVTLTGDAAVQANFSTNAYSLGVGAGTGGSILVPTSSPVNVLYGTPSIITASANPGYTFLNWTLISGSATFASQTDISTTVTLTASAVVRANFTVNHYSLSVGTTTGGTITAPTSSPVSVTYGTPVTITASPNPGYTFVNWTVISGTATFDNANSNSTTVTLTGDAAVQANFSTNTYSLSVGAGTGGSILVPTSLPVNVPFGTPITITASASTGYTFLNWTVISGSATIASPTDISTTVTLTASAVVRANFTANHYSLSVGTTTGGTITAPTSSPVSVTYGTPAIITASANPGYTFVNWTVISGTATFENANSNSTTVTLTEDATVQANFSTNTYTLGVGAGTGGSISVPTSSPVNVPYGTPTTITASANPGYTFLNWTVISGSATIASPTSISTSVTLTGNVVVQANFSANIYSLSVGAATGGIITVPTSSPVNVTYGMTTNITADANPGYIFVNWTVTSGTATFGSATSISTTVTLTENAAIQANFLPIYSLNVVAGTGGMISTPGSSPVSVTYGSFTTITASENPGYTFSGWTLISGTATFDNAASISTTVTLTGNAVVQANFTANLYSLGVGAGIGGTISAPGSSPVSVTYGSSTTITASENPGYTFSGWTLISGTATFDNAASISTTVTLTGNAVVQANFTANLYSLSVGAETGGTISAPGSSPVNVTYGSLTTITASENPGYTFSGWTLISGSATFDNAASISTTVTLTENAVVQANFTANIYSLSVGAGTGGTISAPGSSPVNVTYGTSTTITASENPGYTFSGWTLISGTATFGDASSISTTVTLTEDAVVQANFQYVGP